MSSTKRFLEVAAALIANGKGQYLVVRRTEKSGPGAGKWEFPGGKIEPGETPSQTVLREIDEELGMVIRPKQVLGHVFYEYPQVKLKLWAVLSECSSQTYELREHDAGQWLSLEEIAKLELAEADWPLLEMIKPKLKS